MRKVTVRRILFSIIAVLVIGLLAAACQRPARLQVTQPSILDSGEIISPGNYTGPTGCFLHFPPAYDGSSQLPLIIVLHGGGGSG